MKITTSGISATVIITLGLCGVGCSRSSSTIGQSVGELSNAVDECRDDFVEPRAAQGLEITPVPLSLEGLTREEIQRIGFGSYLVNAIGQCADCHTFREKGFMAGGFRFPLGPVNFVTSRNLTPDPNTGLTMTEGEFVEVMRRGRDVDIENARLLVMPWESYRWMSRGDLSAIYAYLKVIPPVDLEAPPDMKDILPPMPFPSTYNEGDVERPLPSDTNGLCSNIRLGFAIQPLVEPQLKDPRVRARFGRGSYLVNSVTACTVCHTNPPRDAFTLRIPTDNFLSGGRVFVAPPPARPPLGSVWSARSMASDLTGTTHGFVHEKTSSFEVFLATIRTGTHVDEDPPRPLGEPMPWQVLSNMLDEDLFAMYTYLLYSPDRTGSGDKRVQDYARWCADATDCQPDETCFENPATGNVNECIGGACADEYDCGACQTCVDSVCVPPDADSECLRGGI